MQKSLLFGLVFWGWSCGSSPSAVPPVPSEEPPSVAKAFDWLPGKWQRVDDAKDQETFENWNRHSGTEFSGIGFTLQRKDTIWMEYLSLKKVDDQWNLEVRAPEESKATVFRGTQHDERGFSCENRTIEFPTSIRYRWADDTLHAQVSGADRTIPFAFTRRN